jgi:hypothetical protein
MESSKGDYCEFFSFGFLGSTACFSIHKEAKDCTSMKDKSFTINILSDEQEAIAWQFAGSK